MNCNDLTIEEALTTYTDSQPIDISKRKLETNKGEFHVRGFTTWTRQTNITEDFRGFLYGDGWVVYVGDREQGYWTTRLNISNIFIPITVRRWNDFEMGARFNVFGIGPMYDITDLVCKGGDTYYINWRTDPFEVKS